MFQFFNSPTTLVSFIRSAKNKTKNRRNDMQRQYTYLPTNTQIRINFSVL